MVDPASRKRSQGNGVASAIPHRLSSIGKLLTTGTRPAGALIEDLLQCAIDVSGGEHGYLVLSTAAPEPFEIHRWSARADRRAADARVSRTVQRRVLSSGEAMNVADTHHDEFLQDAISVRESAIRSVLCLPLRKDSSPVGCLYLDDRRPAAFELARADLLELICSLMMVAVTTAELRGVPPTVAHSPPLEFSDPSLDELNVETLVSVLVREAAKRVPAACLAILLREPDGTLVLRDGAYHGAIQPDISFPHRAGRLDALETAPGTLLSGGRAALFSGTRSSFQLPLRTASVAWGVLHGEWTDSDSANGQHLALLKPLVAAMSHHLARAMVYKESVAAKAAPILLSSIPSEVLTGAVQVAASDERVLLQGETGTGKESMARFIHRLSSRAAQPLLAMGCGQISPALASSQLFGHVRGSFTGAVRDFDGILASADGGTVFLDDVHRLPSEAQDKVLRFLDSGEIAPVGGEARGRRVNVRVIAATNQDLERMVERGTFLEDLYYRLSVLRIDVPPLRERTPALLRLFAWMLASKSRKAGRPCPPTVSPSAQSMLLSHEWRGNLRELDNAAAYAITRDTDGLIDQDDLPASVHRRCGNTDRLTFREREREHTREGLLDAVRRTRGNIKRAAALLGLPRSTLRDMLVRYGFDARQLRGSRGNVMQRLDEERPRNSL